MSEKVSITLLVKLGSIAVHAKELLSEKSHPFDVDALKTLLNDSEVKSWLAKMRAQALIPEERER